MKKARGGLRFLQPTPLIGRKQETASARRQLLRVRLLTLTGPPGVGKTRLALAVADDVQDAFEDGVIFVDLAPLRDPMLVMPAILRALDLRSDHNQPPTRTLRDYLEDKQLLLLLDNFEHVLEAAGGIADLLAGCPSLKILITSRAVLRLSWEYEFPVPVLAMPDLGRLPQPSALAEWPAVALFTERARALVPDFALTTDNANAVAEICVRLEGLPLAIELAAARSKLFPPEAMVDQLQDRLEFLSRGSRNLPQRHQTLRRAIGWSYGLLEDSERQLFRRLSVFVGGSTLAAAEAVCSDPDGPAANVTTCLESLLDKSLLQRETNPDEEVRFRFLETIRQYAYEQLVEASELQLIERRYANYYLAYAEGAESKLTGSAQATWLARLEQEHDNIRAALRWSHQHAETELGIRLCSALGRFWERHGYSNEGRTWFQTLLSAGGETSAAFRAKALNVAGNLARSQGDYSIACAHYEDALALRRRIGDEQGIAATLNNLGVAAKDQGAYTSAREYFEQSLALKRKLGESRGTALTLSNLGLTLKALGDVQGARLSLEESLGIFQALDDKWGIALALSNLGAVANAANQPEEGIKQFSASLSLRWELKDKWGLAECLEGLARASCERRNIDRALHLLGAAEALRETLGFPLPPDERADLDRHVAIVRSKVSYETFTSAWAAGRAMPLEKTLTFALQDADSHVPEPTAALRISLLGDFQMTCGDVRVTDEMWGRPQAMAIFQYLVLHRDRAISPDELADVFWAQARSVQQTSLYTTLSRVRRALQRLPGLPPSGLVARVRRGYRFVPLPGTWIDVEAFEEAIRAAGTAQGAGQTDEAIGHFQRAISLYKGDLLADTPYSEWCALERESLRRRFFETALKLGNIQESRGRHGDAAEVYRQILERDGTLEAAHQGLMRCYATTGHRDLALRQYEECATRLRSDVEAQPSDETITLYQSILRADRRS